jgi:hypothetical protein
MNNDISKQGYKSNSPYRNSPYLVISSPKGVITMNQVDKPLVVKDLQYGDTRVLQPNSGNHFFKGNKMLEIPFNNKTDNNDNMQYRTGGWLFNELANDGKLLPYLKRQEGGNTGYRNMRDLVESNKNVELRDEDREMMGEKGRNDYDGYEDYKNDDESTDTSDFDSRIKEALTKERYNLLPMEIRDELEFFKENPDEQSKLTEDYVVKYMPVVHSFLSPPQGKTDEPKPTAVIEDFETRDNPKFQYGGYTNFQDYSNARQQSSPPTTPKYETGMRIQYRSGGQIKEGVIQHYDHVTGKIKLY